MVAFAQGAAIGAMMRGVPVANNQYAGDAFGWLHPFSVLTGIGLVLGYALLGAGWLVLKSESTQAPLLKAICETVIGELLSRFSPSRP